MVNRVILGKRGSNYGLWVSKPTKDVETAGVSDLLFSMDGDLQRLVTTGSWVLPSSTGTYSMSIPGAESYLLHIKLFDITDGYVYELSVSVGETWYATTSSIYFVKNTTSVRTLRYVILSGLTI